LRQDGAVMRSAGRHASVAVVLGVIAGVLVGLAYHPDVGPLAGYDVGALVFIVPIWLAIWPMDANATSTHAASEDPTRAAADVMLLTAAVASLAAIGFLIAQTNSHHGSTRNFDVTLGACSVALSWLVVHTVFTLKYARLYYRGGGIGYEGGVEFEDQVRPPYTDFAYLAFTVGMTFQVSDTDLQSTEYRRLALRHALLSYLFGAVILAVAINLIAGLTS
jgi:uncharacterized membrane protein